MSTTNYGYAPAGPASRAVYIVDGNRTPFLKARGKPGPFTAADLAVAAGKTLLVRQPFLPGTLDEVILGCIIPGPDEANISRIVALRLGCGEEMPAFTVQRNCGTGMQAIDTAAMHIATGRSDLILAGGTEAMSHSPLLLQKPVVATLGKFYKAKSPLDYIRAVSDLRPRHLMPIISLLLGLTDVTTGLSMGQTAENLAHEFHISREQMDRFALESNTHLAEAQDEGFVEEISPIFDADSNYYNHDDGVRRDTNLDKLGTLRPVFDRPFGNVTAGNSAQVTDGAALVIMASKDAVDRYNLPILGRVVDCHWSALSPARMGLGPVRAMASMLRNQKLGTGDIDYWEINEAFAAQVLACMHAWSDSTFFTKELGLEAPFNPIPRDRLNVDGGAIALGHPVGTSGARIVLHLLHILNRNKARRGVASQCIGGGQGGAMLVERVEE